MAKRVPEYLPPSTTFFPPNPLHQSELDESIEPSLETFLRLKREEAYQEGGGEDSDIRLVWERFAFDLDFSWKRVARDLREAETLLFCPKGGLGDILYDLLISYALAIHFPEKQVLFILPQTLKPLVADPLGLTNWQVTSDPKNNKIEQCMVCNFIGLPDRHLFLEEVCRPTTQVVIGDSYVHELHYSAHFLMKFLAEGPKPFSTFLSGQRPYNRALPGQEDATYQLVAINAILKYLLNVTLNQGLLSELPFWFPEKTADSYDVVIVYDARADLRKILPLETLIRLCQHLYQENPSLRIGIVQGLDHPSVATELIKLFPQLRLIDGSIPEVSQQLMNSRKVISVDTFWQHYLNFALHYADTHPLFIVPALLVIFSLRSPFPVGGYAPDRGSTVVCTSTLEELEASVVVDWVMETNQPRLNLGERSK